LEIQEPNHKAAYYIKKQQQYKIVKAISIKQYNVFKLKFANVDDEINNKNKFIKAKIVKCNEHFGRFVNILKKKKI